MHFLLGAIVTASILIFAAVFERLCAAFWMFVKFNGDWVSPIYLNVSTVLLFFGGTLLLCLAKVIGARTAVASKRGILKWAIALDLASFSIVGAMLATGVARLT